jgi:hypothetical protein
MSPNTRICSAVKVFDSVYSLHRLRKLSSRELVLVIGTVLAAFAVYKISGGNMKNILKLSLLFTLLLTSNAHADYVLNDLDSLPIEITVTNWR